MTSEVTWRCISHGRGKEGGNSTGLCWLEASGVDMSKGRLVSGNLWDGIHTACVRWAQILGLNPRCWLCCWCCEQIRSWQTPDKLLSTYLLPPDRDLSCWHEAAPWLRSCADSTESLKWQVVQEDLFDPEKRQTWDLAECWGLTALPLTTDSQNIFMQTPAACLRGYRGCWNPKKEPQEPEHRSYLAVAEHIVLACCMAEELCAAGST